LTAPPKFKETLDRERRSSEVELSPQPAGAAALTAGGISLVTPEMSGRRREASAGQARLSSFARKRRHGALGYFSKN